MKILITETNGISLNFSKEEWAEIVKNAQIGIKVQNEEPKEVLKNPFARMGKMNIFFIKELYSFYGNSEFDINSTKLKELRKKYLVEQLGQTFDSLQLRGGCIVTKSTDNRLQKIKLTINSKFI